MAFSQPPKEDKWPDFYRKRRHDDDNDDDDASFIEVYEDDDDDEERTERIPLVVSFDSSSTSSLYSPGYLGRHHHHQGNEDDPLRPKWTAGLLVVSMLSLLLLLLLTETPSSSATDRTAFIDQSPENSFSSSSSSLWTTDANALPVAKQTQEPPELLQPKWDDTVDIYAWLHIPGTGASWGYQYYMMALEHQAAAAAASNRSMHHVPWIYPPSHEIRVDDTKIRKQNIMDDDENNYNYVELYQDYKSPRCSKRSPKTGPPYCSTGELADCLMHNTAIEKLYSSSSSPTSPPPPSKPRSVRFLTVLRHPVDRVLAEYYQWSAKTTGRKPWPSQMDDLSLRKWILDPTNVAHNRQAQYLLMHNNNDNIDKIKFPSSSTQCLAFQGDKTLDWIQTTYGSVQALNALDITAAEMLAASSQHNRFAFVAVMEDLAGSTAAFRETFGMDPTMDDGHNDDEDAMSTIQSVLANDHLEIDQEIHKLIEERNQLDLRLYEYVQEQNKKLQSSSSSTARTNASTRRRNKERNSFHNLPAETGSSVSSSSISLLTTGGMSSTNASSNTLWTGWSFCNQAQQPAVFANLHFPSPRRAICPLVNDWDNDLTFPQIIPGHSATKTENQYAHVKEIYLSEKCDNSLWVVMFKSGNLDSRESSLCPPKPDNANHHNPFNNHTMNQPLMVHHYDPQNYSYFAGTYDVDSSWSPFQVQQVQLALHRYMQAWIDYDDSRTYDNRSSPTKPTPPPLLQNASFLATTWSHKPGRHGQKAGLVYSSIIETSAQHPWLMNYLRANDGVGTQNPVGYGGYPWRGAGNLKGPVSVQDGYKLQMSIHLTILERNTHQNNVSLFYMPEFGGCWKKSDGSPCNDDENDNDNLTRYLCFSIFRPRARSPCESDTPERCPQWHYSVQYQEWISAFNSSFFPYECYHQYCGPAASESHHDCDPFSNPIPQELMQLLPCAEWGYYGFPTKELEEGSSSYFELNVGDLGNNVFFYDAAVNNTNPPTTIPDRSWISFEVGPEVGVQSGGEPERARWEIRGWDIEMAPRTSLEAKQ